jgi:hypothetical protein
MRCFVLCLTLALVPALGCGRVDALEPCDVLKQECQRDAYFAVVRMRGDGFDAFGGVPPIRTITLDEYRASLEDEPEPDEPEPDEPEPEEPEDTRSPRSRAFDTALGLLGLLSPRTTTAQAAVSDSVGNVVAYYSGGTGEVTVIDRGGERVFERETSTLVHELIHAFQGREPPVDYSDGTIDDSFARRALIEGEAELYEQLATAEMLDTAGALLDWDAFYTNWIEGSRSRLNRSREPYFRISRGFAYPLGGHRMVDAWLEGGNPRVRAIFEQRPRTSQYFMALRAGSAQRQPVETACRSAPPEDELSSFILDRFGAAQLYGFLSIQLQDDDYAWEQALGWKGDAMRIYGDEEAQRVALSWRVLLDDAERAEQLRARIEDRPEREPDEDTDDEMQPPVGALRASVQDAFLIIHAATEPELLDGWRDGIECDPFD